MAAPVPTLVGSIVENASDGSVAVPNTTPPAVGDYLVAFIGAYANGGSRALDTPVGWTRGVEQDSDEQICAVFTKRAVLADTTAPSFPFTISGGGADVFSACVIKVTNVPVGSEIAASEIDIEDPGSGSLFSYVSNSAAVTAESLALMMFMGANNGLSAAPTIATYASTPARSWSELADIGATNGGSTDPTMAFAVASAPNTGTSPITLRTAECDLALNDARRSILIILNGTEDAAGTAALLAATPTIFTPVGHAGTSGSAAPLQATPTIFVPVGSEDSPSEKWSGEALPETDWENEPLP